MLYEQPLGTKEQLSTILLLACVSPLGIKRFAAQRPTNLCRSALDAAIRNQGLPSALAAIRYSASPISKSI